MEFSTINLILVKVEDNYKFQGRRRLLAWELKKKGIVNKQIIKSIESIPRHLFIDPGLSEQAYIDKQTFQYLYNDADKYFFMNADSYEQIELSKDQLNDKELLLKPNQEVTLSMYMGKPIDIQLPATINLLVTHSEPAVKGDSVNSNNKEVTCETGLTIQVPMFIEENDVIKIDTKAISYITRV